LGRDDSRASFSKEKYCPQGHNRVRFVRLRPIKVFYFIKDYGTHQGLSLSRAPWDIPAARGSQQVMPTTGNIKRRGTGKQPMAFAGDAHLWI